MQLFLINFKKQNTKILTNKFQKNHSGFFVDYILKNFFKINDVLKKEENGKPYLENNSFKISISHSENLIAILFDKNNCGVDVEYIKPRNYKKILSRFNVEKEYSLEEFYQWWTIFEAEFKSKNKKETINFIYKNFMCGISSFDRELEVFEVIYENEDNINTKFQQKNFQPF